jgi:L-gulono-1,4-lactone dehydrogenase
MRRFPHGIVGDFDARSVSLMKRRRTSWRNWSRTYSCSPARVFRPRSLEDLVAIVRQAGQAGKRVRVAGRGHTMSPLSVTDDYLVLASALNRIGPVDTARRLVTVESGVTIGALDKVLRRHGLALPTNVVLTCVQYGGVVATGCHGAGWECQTISDLVEAMTIVTCTGEVVTFREETHGTETMNAVRCNLGVFGLIYQITLRVEPMFSLEVVDEHLPLGLVEDLSQLKALLSGNDYVEVFWFPLADGLWAKSWNRTTTPAGRASWTRVPVEFVTTQMAAMLWGLVVRRPRLTAPVNNVLYRYFTPRHRKVVRDAVDATHYRNFIELLRNYIMSFAITIDPDFANVRAAWQVVVDKVRERAADGEYPLNLVLEMRVIRNSTVLLSPAFGPPDQHHCYFELISFHGTPDCHRFFDEVAHAWMAMPELNARPHWAKYFYEVPGIISYVHRVWGGNVARFAALREAVDPDGMFLNPALERIFNNHEEPIRRE